MLLRRAPGEKGWWYDTVMLGMDGCVCVCGEGIKWVLGPSQAVKMCSNGSGSAERGSAKCYVVGAQLLLGRAPGGV